MANKKEKPKFEIYSFIIGIFIGIGVFSWSHVFYMEYQDFKFQQSLKILEEIIEKKSKEKIEVKI